MYCKVRQKSGSTLLGDLKVIELGRGAERSRQVNGKGEVEKQGEEV